MSTVSFYSKYFNPVAGEYIVTINVQTHIQCNKFLFSRHLLMSTLAAISIKIKGYIIKTNEMLLGVTVDANLNLNCHLENILKKLVKKFTY